MKKCNKCREYKTFTEFNNDKTRKDGLSYNCKQCRYKHKSYSRGTYEYFIKNSLHSINQRTVNGSCPRPNDKNKIYFDKGIRIEFTKDEFYDFCLRYKDLIENMYRIGEVPTVDRIDNNGHYRLDNIQIITLKENTKKSNKER